MKGNSLWLIFVVLLMNAVAFQGCSDNDDDDETIGTYSFERVYGGAGNDEGSGIVQTPDGGYAICGKISAGNYSKLAIIRLDNRGNEQWTMTYDQEVSCNAHSIQNAADGGLILTGTCTDPGFSSSRIILLKTDAFGREQWIKDWRPADWCVGYAVRQTIDGGFIICAYMNREGYYDAYSDIYLIKTNDLGEEEWARTIGNEQDDAAFDVRQTADGGYILCGYTVNSPKLRGYLVKTDSAGIVEWTQSEVGPQYTYLYSIQQTQDGGYIVVGNTGLWTFYLIKTDSAGNEEWAKTFYEDVTSFGYSIIITPDQDYVLAGERYTDPDDILKSDIIIIKLDPTGALYWEKSYQYTPYNYVNEIIQATDGGFALCGQTGNWERAEGDIYVIKTDPKGEV